MQLSIVVPVHRSADCLPELAKRVRASLRPHFESYELILVNDCSPDESWDVIVRLAAEHDFVTGVNLRRNVGQDNALMAGLHRVRGEVVVIMDDDLQHNPSDIPRLYNEIRKGYDIVYANFERKQQAWWKNLGSWFNDRVAVLLLQKPKHIYMSPFKALRREVVREIIRYEGPYAYVDGLIFTVTSNVAQISAAHNDRFSGESNYNLRRSIRVWLKLVTSFSVIPLRLVMVLGTVIAVVALGTGTYFILQRLFSDYRAEGWASTIVAIFFLGGVQLIGIGAVGEYIGRMYITVNKCAQFAVKETCGGDKVSGKD